MKLEGGAILLLEFTAASEVVTEVRGQTGWTIGDFSTGVATLSFPANFRSLTGIGVPNTDNATASSRQDLLVRAVDESAGTATLRVVDAGSGATEAIADGTYYLVMFVGL